MDFKGLEGDGMRTRSFRNENYKNRRVFLRSYPLNQGEDEDNKEGMEKVTDGGNGKKPIKKIILSVFHWGEGKVLVLRRFKHKLTIYAIACIPVAFKIKTPTVLISG